MDNVVVWDVGEEEKGSIPYKQVKVNIKKEFFGIKI